MVIINTRDPPNTGNHLELLEAVFYLAFIFTLLIAPGSWKTTHCSASPIFCSQSGDHSEASLTKFGFKLDLKVIYIIDPSTFG
jgi:hypothetical protein